MKTQPKLFSSIEYEKFKYNHEQRPIKVSHVKHLMESMESFGFLSSKPIQVYAEKNKWIIVDGHHRLVAAKNLGIPVLCVAESSESQSTIAAVNELVNRWRLVDFVNMYVKQGKRDYALLLGYHSKGIPITIAAAMMIGIKTQDGGYQKGNGICVTEQIKRGSFVASEFRLIDMLCDFMEKFKGQNKAFTTRTFIVAMDSMMRVADFDIMHLAKRVATNPTIIQRCATIEQMFDSIEEAYNYRSTIKIPLAFEAKKIRAKSQS